MKKTLLTILTLVLTVAVGTQIANAIGTLTPSVTAGDDTHYSLNDIYNKLTDFTSSPSATTSPFTTPGSVSASFYTLTEIYNLLTAENTDLVAGNIATGTSIFGVAGTLATGLPKTGQTTSYTANDDGDLETGIILSYTDNGNGTVTDNATGLIWQKSGAYQSPSWQGAINYCANNVASLPGSGWRLPNYKELVSIVDLGRGNPSIDSVFTNTQSVLYWSGTTYHDNTDNAWGVNFYDGYGYDDAKSGGYYARCVR